MSENPDIKWFKSMANITGVSSAPPIQGDLRFIERAEHNKTEEYVKTARILQQYQWIQKESVFDWYDIPEVAERLKDDKEGTL